MNPDYDPNVLAREMERLSPVINYVYVIGEKVDGTQLFVLAVKRRIPTDEMVSICRDMAAVIRLRMGERPDDWMAAIHAEQYAALTMGIYFIGWEGRPDKWHLHKGQERSTTYDAEFLALRDRLRDILVTFGVEGSDKGRDGDFTIEDGEMHLRRQYVFIRNPEYLTPELVAALQGVLRDGYTDWTVDLTLDLPPPLDRIPNPSIDVRADGVREKWNRRQLKRALGDRLKI